LIIIPRLKQIKMNRKEKESHNIFITKASGEQEPFRIEKLKQSMRKAGATEDVIEQVADDIGSWIVDGIPTRKIYARAFSLLRKKKRPVASRYKLKQAIMELGPTGHPFEHLIARVIETQGYAVEVGRIIRGRCVSHEVDVVATRDHHQLFVECKYGQSADKTVNVQVPLYVRSRVDDIIRKRHELPEYAGYSFGGCVASNTRFTTDAIDYGTCSGLTLMSWDYPAGDGIRDIIDREHIYPITVLHRLTRPQKQDLLDRGIVICRQILEHPETLDRLNLGKDAHAALMRELMDIIP
jgi:translation initiation factor 2 beta subunit (eIF-2beta)/eIF-5